MRENQLSEKIHHLTEVDGRSLFEIRWSSDSDALVQPLIDSGADVLRAEGTAGVWEFRLQFRDRVRVATFRESCLDSNIQMQLNALYNPVVPVNHTDSDLTDEQYDIIETAYRQGYWEIPQQITLDELAESIGISTDTASKRLRHGLTSLMDASFQPE
ncbi:helix-turn-helix domain-containing protein [Halocatena marina]|uniref:Helix-turn-helix domain-containing protein n=1 Tax=Halocatena marina TaxID=2934937 RepID=A0ABD5YJR3_9EURY